MFYVPAAGGTATVAIVGRVNVGKSTLFNRLCEARRALVHEQPGVTRDWLAGEVTWEGRKFTLIDTGGIEGAQTDPLADQVAQLSHQVAAQADLVLLVVDRKTGLMPGDTDCARWLRQRGRPVLLVVNKVDLPGQETEVAEFAQLGFDPVCLISAEHGRGLSELLDAIVAVLPAVRVSGAEHGTEPGALAVAILGPPNAGKSTLVNRILGSPRCLVSELPGTTRDAVDIACEIEGRRYLFVDTAGLRRGRRQGLSGLSSLKADAALARAEVAVLVLDAAAGVGGLEAAIAGQIENSSAAAVLALNKWDLVEQPARRAGSKAPAATALPAATVAERAIRKRIPGLHYAPWIPISARTGANIRRLLEYINEVALNRARRLSTRELNRFLVQLQERRTIGASRGKALKIYYGTQAGERPPRFRLFTNTASLPPATHRYLVARIRERFELSGTPIRLQIVLR
jgi:GTP-binding protein